MRRTRSRRAMIAVLLAGVALSLSSCVVYEGGPYYGRHEGGWHHEGWERGDRWR